VSSSVRAHPCARAVRLIIYGQSEGPDGKPIDFIEAGRLNGIKPDLARRYLDRTDVRALLRSERRTFREALCAGNEAALKRICDGENAAATVHSVQVWPRHRRSPLIAQSRPPVRSSACAVQERGRAGASRPLRRRRARQRSCPARRRFRRWGDVCQSNYEGSFWDWSGNATGRLGTFFD
jgi:hypothetical protein